MTDEVRGLAENLLGRGLPQGTSLRQGTVVSVAAGDATARLAEFPGADIAVLSSYGPAVGDVVFLLENRTDLLILGSLRSLVPSIGGLVVPPLILETNSGNFAATVTVTGQTLTFAARPNWLYEVRFHGHVESSVAGDSLTARFQVDNATNMLAHVTTVDVANRMQGAAFGGIIRGLAAGLRSVALTVTRTTGSGTMYLPASASNPRMVYVKDAGPDLA